MEEHNDNIPKEFRKADENFALHQHCKICERELLESNEVYCIEKVVKNNPQLGEAQELFHFAICLHCLYELRQRLSAESRQAMENFQRQRIMEVQQEGDFDPEKRFETKSCFFSGKPVDEMDHYQMVAFCQGHSLRPEQPPMIVGSDILEDSNELLSAQTREELDDFVGDNFGGPPEIARLLKDGEIVIL